MLMTAGFCGSISFLRYASWAEVFKPDDSSQASQRQQPSGNVAIGEARLCDVDSHQTARAANQAAREHGLATGQPNPHQPVRKVIFSWCRQRILAAPKPRNEDQAGIEDR